MTLTRKIFVILCLATLVAGAQEKIPRLTAQGQTYSNVTVTAVSATDLFFSYAGGMGNVKLKDLDPKLQAHFHYDATNGTRLEQQRATNNAMYRQYMMTNQPPPTPVENGVAGSGDDDFVSPQVFARLVRGHQPPQFYVERWLTPKPDITGKFVMLFFWMTTSEPCRQTISQLNAMHERFHNRLVIIAISNEPEAAVRGMTEPPIEFASAIDTQGSMARALEITAVPHCILIDPHSIVRYEGVPAYLNDERLEHFLMKYQ